MVLCFLCLLCSCRKSHEHNRHSYSNEKIEQKKQDSHHKIKETDAQEIISGNDIGTEKQLTEQENTTIVSVDKILLPQLIVRRNSKILQRLGYITSYNTITKNANWVAWHLTKEHTDGKWKRDGIPYMVDEEISGSRQELDDWYGHNLPIDHGHMCPAGDNKWSKEAMEQTFLLTNMCPQNSELNRGDWEVLESKCRGWARHYGEIYIVCGPIFYSNSFKTIGKNKVGVPDAFFKVILCINKRPKALGFIYPNDGAHHKINHYVTTIDDVEKQTGIDFFYNLPDEIENEIESNASLSAW